MKINIENELSLAYGKEAGRILFLMLEELPEDHPFIACYDSYKNGIMPRDSFNSELMKLMIHNKID